MFDRSEVNVSPLDRNTTVTLVSGTTVVSVVAVVMTGVAVVVVLLFVVGT